MEQAGIKEGDQILTPRELDYSVEFSVDNSFIENRKSGQRVEVVIVTNDHVIVQTPNETMAVYFRWELLSN